MDSGKLLRESTLNFNRSYNSVEEARHHLDAVLGTNDIAELSEAVKKSQASAKRGIKQLRKALRYRRKYDMEAENV